MLGRHVYRVHQAMGRWTVTKDGEAQARGEFPGRETAVSEACRLAEADQPSRVVIDNGDGALVEERLYGSDVADELNALKR